MKLYENRTFFNNPSSNQASFARHQEKVCVLETVSDLIGCTRTFSLGDGLIPDVIRLNDSQTLLFIGDAKETEHPNNKDTKTRLYNYLLWLRAFVSKQHKQGVFVICFKNKIDQEEWLSCIKNLANQSSIKFSSCKVTTIDNEINLLWFYFSHQVH